LKELDVDSIPMNFLNPIPGTPLENLKPMEPLEILRLIAVYRFIHPSKDIIICGGREVNLRSLQSMIFLQVQTDIDGELSDYFRKLA